MAKGKKKLNKSITKLVKPFGITKARLGREWMYDTVKETIDFQTDLTDWTDDLFNAFVTKEFGLKNFDTFVISMLHEIGHYMTEDELTEMDILKSGCGKIRVAEVIQSPNATQKDKEKAEMKYFMLPDEYAATAWAVDFYNENREACEKMQRKAHKAIRKFEKKNGVTK